MYTESEFMDMSLQSRMSRINEEVAKLTLWYLNIIILMHTTHRKICFRSRAATGLWLRNFPSSLTLWCSSRPGHLVSKFSKSLRVAFLWFPADTLPYRRLLTLGAPKSFYQTKFLPQGSNQHSCFCPQELCHAWCASLSCRIELCTLAGHWCLAYRQLGVRQGTAPSSQWGSASAWEWSV